MLDLELLRSFVSVVDAGGFTWAGERVHRTQSTVSQQIRRLEEDVGQPLLHRIGKDVTPTEAGERLLSYARRLLALAEEARDVMARPDNEGTMRLGVPEDFPLIVWQNCWRRFRLASRLRLDVRADQSAKLKREIERGELDLALFKRTAGEKSAIAVWPERVHWVTSKSRPRDTAHGLGAADRLSLRLSVPCGRHPRAGERGPKLAHGLYVFEPTPASRPDRRRHGLQHPVRDRDHGRTPRADGKGRLRTDRQDRGRAGGRARGQPGNAAAGG